jgi:hypothetical protein
MMIVALQRNSSALFPDNVRLPAPSNPVPHALVSHPFCRDVLHKHNQATTINLIAH